MTWRRCKLFCFRRLRGFFLYALLQPFDLFLKWLHLRFEILVLRLESVSLRLHLFKLSIEVEHLTFVLLTQSQGSGNVSDLPHDRSSQTQSTSEPSAPL